MGFHQQTFVISPNLTPVYAEIKFKKGIVRNESWSSMKFPEATA